jgi:hypothetical protein
MSTDLAMLAASPATIEEAADPAVFVTLACERAKTWLAQALDHGQIEQIVELKSQAEAIRVYTAQKQLGRDAELSAAEIVRRAERCIHLAVDKGREAGRIAPQGVTRYRPGHHAVSETPGEGATPVLVGDLVNREELHNTRALRDVSDEQFEEAITQAKEEGNLSRANVVRKATGKTLVSDRPEVLRGTRRLDSNRIVEQTVRGAEPVGELLDLVDYSALDPTHLEEWVSSLSGSIKRLRRLQSDLEKELSRV